MPTRPNSARIISPCTVTRSRPSTDPGGCVCFFQAEDGIRDDLVTGVQTCALPISTQVDLLTPSQSATNMLLQYDLRNTIEKSVMEFETLNELFFAAMETYRRPDVLRYKSGGTWQSVSWKQMLERTRDLALGLHELGVRRGDRVVLLSENRPEWFIIDKGLHIIGAANVPIYSTLTAPQVSYVIRNSESKVVIASSALQQAKVAEVRSELRAVEQVIRIDAPGDSGLESLSLDEVLARGARKAADEQELHRRLASEVRSDDLASIIYTSGTTGDPKGVMITHRNFASNVAASHQ